MLKCCHSTPTCFNHLRPAATCQLSLHSLFCFGQCSDNKTKGDLWLSAWPVQIEAQTSLGNRSGCALNCKENSLLLALRTLASSLSRGSPLAAGIAQSKSLAAN